jgi:membrane associated rhomboid family serine protease
VLPAGVSLLQSALEQSPLLRCFDSLTLSCSVRCQFLAPGPLIIAMISRCRRLPAVAASSLLSRPLLVTAALPARHILTAASLSRSVFVVRYRAPLLSLSSSRSITCARRTPRNVPPHPPVPPEGSEDTRDSIPPTPPSLASSLPTESVPPASSDSSSDSHSHPGEDGPRPISAKIIRVLIGGAVAYYLIEHTQFGVRLKKLPEPLMWLTGLHVLVFAMHHTLPQRWVMRNLYSSFDMVRAGRVHTLVTSFISHQGMLHLLANSWGILLFGPPILQVMGSTTQFFAFYGLAGLFSSIVATLCSGFLCRAGIRSAMRSQLALGASGAVMALIGMSTVLFPDHPKYSILGLSKWMGLEEMAPWVVGFDLLLGVYHFASGTRPFLGNWAHLSGFGFGYVYAHTYLRQTNRRVDLFLTKREQDKAKKKMDAKV